MTWQEVCSLALRRMEAFFFDTNWPVGNVANPYVIDWRVRVGSHVVTEAVRWCLQNCNALLLANWPVYQNLKPCQFSSV